MVVLPFQDFNCSFTHIISVSVSISSIISTNILWYISISIRISIPFRWYDWETIVIDLIIVRIVVTHTSLRPCVLVRTVATKNLVIPLTLLVRVIMSSDDDSSDNNSDSDTDSTAELLLEFTKSFVLGSGISTGINTSTTIAIVIIVTSSNCTDLFLNSSKGFNKLLINCLVGTNDDDDDDDDNNNNNNNHDDDDKCTW